VIVQLAHQIFVDVLPFPRPKLYGHLHSFPKDINAGFCCPEYGLLYNLSTAASGTYSLEGSVYIT
jgi:hypothetical protein